MYSKLSLKKLVALAIGFFSAVSASAQYRTVAIDGEQAPGTDVTFSEFGRPIINGNGEVAFYAVIDDFKGSGVWSEKSGTLSNVMLVGATAPGTSLDFISAGYIQFNQSGHTLFRAGLDGYGFDLIWTDRSGTLAPVVAPGQTVPGSSQFFRGATHISANSLGNTVFKGSTNPIPASGIYSEGTGTLAVIVETNTSNYSDLGIPVINDNGHIAFSADKPGANGIYTDRSGALTTAAVQGQAAPGGGMLSTLFRHDIAMNNAGDIAFKNLLTGATVNGLYVSSNDGSLRKIASTGDKVPGTSTTFTDNSIILASVFLSDSGHAIFRAEQLADGNRGILRETAGELDLIVAIGDSAPGTSNLFAGIAGFTASPNGRIAFKASIDNENFDGGIWLLDANDTLVCVVKAGDMIAVAPGDIREVEQVFMQDFFTDRAAAVNDLGQVAFQAYFLDGSAGVFVSDSTNVTSVVGSFIYHHNSSFAGVSIANALDTTKQVAKAGVPQQTLGLNNLINSSRGLNGLVFDIVNMPGTPTASDFQFQMSPTGPFDLVSNPPLGWVQAPAPASVTVEVGSPSRIVVTWPDNVIANRWLRTTILANRNTGLITPEVYFAGHLLGETTGHVNGTYSVSFADITPIRQEIGSATSAGNPFDIDKNGIVAFADISAMRGAVGTQLTNITVTATE